MCGPENPPACAAGLHALQGSQSAPVAGRESTGWPGAASTVSLAAGGRTRQNTRMLPLSSCQGDAAVHSRPAAQRASLAGGTSWLSASHAYILPPSCCPRACRHAGGWRTKHTPKARLQPAQLHSPPRPTWMVLCSLRRSTSPSCTLRSASASAFSSLPTWPAASAAAAAAAHDYQRSRGTASKLCRLGRREGARSVLAVLSPRLQPQVGGCHHPQAAQRWPRAGFTRTGAPGHLGPQRLELRGPALRARLCQPLLLRYQSQLLLQRGIDVRLRREGEGRDCSGHPPMPLLTAEWNELHQ